MTGDRVAALDVDLVAVGVDLSAVWAAEIVAAVRRDVEAALGAQADTRRPLVGPAFVVVDAPAVSTVSRWSRVRAVSAIVAALVVVSGCIGADAVPWDTYRPDLRSWIDELADAGDCAALQVEFDVADANDDAQRARVGRGNANLMAYIHDRMTDAGCYG